MPGVDDVKRQRSVFVLYSEIEYLDTSAIYVRCADYLLVIVRVGLKGDDP
jgi:hypothetical protein